MFKIGAETLTLDLKNHIFKRFTDHSISQVGTDMKNPSVSFVAREETGEFAGAIVCELFWGALYVKYLVIDEGLRGKRLGTLLLEKAEAFGRENNCGFSFLETMSFQALDFYIKNGYLLEFTRDGFYQGHSFHYLKKNLLSVVDNNDNASVSTAAMDV
jgi:ribosomal protein S18 acetylase RimI-like enzyme